MDILLSLATSNFTVNWSIKSGNTLFPNFIID